MVLTIQLTSHCPVRRGDRHGLLRVLRPLHPPQPHVQEAGRCAAQEQAVQRAYDVPHEGKVVVVPTSIHNYYALESQGLDWEALLLYCLGEEKRMAAE